MRPMSSARSSKMPLSALPSVRTRRISAQMVSSAAAESPAVCIALMSWTVSLDWNAARQTPRNNTGRHTP